MCVTRRRSMSIRVAITSFARRRSCRPAQRDRHLGLRHIRGRDSIASASDRQAERWGTRRGLRIATTSANFFLPSPSLRPRLASLSRLSASRTCQRSPWIAHSLQQAIIGLRQPGSIAGVGVTRAKEIVVPPERLDAEPPKPLRTPQAMGTVSPLLSRSRCGVGEIMKREKQVSFAASRSSSGLKRAWSTARKGAAAERWRGDRISRGGVAARFGTARSAGTALSAIAAALVVRRTAGEIAPLQLKRRIVDDAPSTETN